MSATIESATNKWRPYGIGIDCHSKFIVIVIIVPKFPSLEQHRHEKEFIVVPAELTRARDWVVDVLRTEGLNPEPLTYALESTATYHMPVIRAFGGQPCLINPALASQFKARKTDRWDASLMAYQSLHGTWTPSFIPDDITTQIKVFLRTRLKRATEASRNYQGIATRLSQWYCPLRGLSTRNAEVRTVIEDLAAGRKPDVSTLPAFQNYELVPKRMWTLFAQMYECAVEASAQAKEAFKQAKALVADTVLLDLLQTAPGVGPITAVTWMAEMEPISRFPHARAAVAYAGFDPTAKVSAGKTVSKECRKGNGQIRRMVVQAAQNALGRSKSGVAEWARTLKSRHHNVRVFALARKLVQALYHVSKKRVAYNEEKHRYGQGQDPNDGGCVRATAAAEADGVGGAGHDQAPHTEDVHERA